MKMIRKISIFIFLLILCLWTMSPIANADSAGYGVTPLLPDNQLTADSFFNLLVSPDTSQELHIQLTNQSNQEKRLKLTVSTASTTKQGTIDYTTTPKLNQGSALDELLTVPDKVTLAANETKVISLTLKIPAKPFTGILLGAITIQEVDQITDSATLNNQFAYQIGVMLRESKDLPEHDVSLNQLTINSKQQFQLTIKNNGRLASGRLTGKWSGKGHPTFNQEIQLAPNTTISLPLPFKEEVVAGNGTLTVTLKIDNQSFTYQQSLYLRKTADGIQLIKLPFPTSMMVAIILGIFAMVSIAVWYWHKKSSSKKTANTANR